MILTWSWQLFKYFTTRHRPLSAFFGVYIYPVIYVLENPFLLSHQIFIERHNPVPLYPLSVRISFQIRRKSSVYFYIILSENNSLAVCHSCLSTVPLLRGKVTTDLINRKQQCFAPRRQNLILLLLLCYAIYIISTDIDEFNVQCIPAVRRWSLNKCFE